MSVILPTTYCVSMAEQEQAGNENVAPESSQPRQQDVPFSKVCSRFQIRVILLCVAGSKHGPEKQVYK